MKHDKIPSVLCRQLSLSCVYQKKKKEEKHYYRLNYKKVSLQREAWGSAEKDIAKCYIYIYI